MRGNVDTRLQKLREREYDAIVLARAGLDRLGVDEGAPVDVAELTPAPGQGCLALEARTGDEEIAELAAAVTDRRALVELTAERAVVTALDATCHTPVGAHARARRRPAHVEGYAGLPDGSAWIRDRLEGDAADPSALGRELAERHARGGRRRAARPGRSRLMNPRRASSARTAAALADAA